MEAWETAHQHFHHAPFWDQSAFCQTLARRKEFLPGVLGAMPTGCKPSHDPWFSWKGGAVSKETVHLHIVDCASLQFANPLHAKFILHFCGYSNKLELSQQTLALRAVHGVEALT
eukprot:5843233-Amphidinium_carterae.1